MRVRLRFVARECALALDHDGLQIISCGSRLSHQVSNACGTQDGLDIGMIAQRSTPVCLEKRFAGCGDLEFTSPPWTGRCTAQQSSAFEPAQRRANTTWLKAGALIKRVQRIRPTPVDGSQDEEFHRTEAGVRCNRIVFSGPRNGPFKGLLSNSKKSTIKSDNRYYVNYQLQPVKPGFRASRG